MRTPEQEQRREQHLRHSHDIHTEFLLNFFLESSSQAGEFHGFAGDFLLQIETPPGDALVLLGSFPTAGDALEAEGASWNRSKLPEVSHAICSLHSFTCASMSQAEGE